MAEKCDHNKLKLTGSEPSPYWVRLTHVCKLCDAAIVTVNERGLYEPEASSLPETQKPSRATAKDRSDPAGE